MSVTSDHYRLLFLCSVLSFAINFEYSFSSTYTNSAGNSFKLYLNQSFSKDGKVMSNSDYSLIWNIIVNIWFVGFFIGIWIGRYIIDKFGRRIAFLIGNGVNVISSIIVCISIPIHQPYVLMTGRIICSTATAISYSALILYLQEVPPSNKRGMMSCLNGTIFSLVALFTITFGNDAILGKDLTWYLGMAILPSTLSFVVLFFLPETPKYLVSIGEIKKAEESIEFYQGKSTDTLSVLKSIENDLAANVSQEVAYMDIIRIKHLRRALWLALAALQNTIALWTILLSSTYYLQQAGVDHSIAQWSSTVMAFAYFLGTITIVKTIDRFGRRPLLIWSNVFNISSLAIYVLCAELSKYIDWLKYGCMIMLTVFGYSFGAGVGPVARFIGAELVPMKYRSLMTAVVFSENTIMSEIFSFSCRPLYNIVGPYAFIILYTVPSIFCLTYLILYLPETKNKETLQIIKTLEETKFMEINVKRLE